MVGLDCLHPILWIDESPITLCQRVRLYRKGVNALSFSSRKRADQVRNDGSGSVMLASRQYPQGGEGETSPKQPLTVIADLIRNPEGGWRGAIRSVMTGRRYARVHHRHSRVGENL